jgi:hypothetical protein
LDWYGAFTGSGVNSFYVSQYYTGGGFSGTCSTDGCEIETVCPGGTGCFVAMWTYNGYGQGYSPVFGGNGDNPWPQPFTNQWYGEVDDPAADIPGSADQGWTTFTGLQYQKVDGTLDPPFDGTWGFGNTGSFPGITQPSGFSRGGHDTLVYNAYSNPRGWAFDIFCTNGPGPNCY